MPAPVVMHLISSLKIGGAERLLIDTMKVVGPLSGNSSVVSRQGLTLYPHLKDGARRIDYVVVIMNDQVDPGFYAELTASGVPVYRLDRPEGKLHPRYMRQLLRIIDSHKVDIVHTHNEGSRAWGMAARLLRPGLQLVYTVHSHDNARSITGWKRAAYGRFVDATVAISQFVADEAQALRPRLLALVPNGVGLDRFRAIAPVPASDGAFRLVNVARFIPFKGQDVLLDALKQARDAGANVRVTFVGTIADQAFYEGLQARTLALGLQDHVAFVLDRSDIEPFFANADAFVLSSREEGFGVAVIEAMAAGLPVIVPDTGGPAEIVDDGRTGLTFPPGDAAALAARIVTVAGDRARGAKLAAAAKTAIRRYDIRRMADDLAKLYLSLPRRG